MEFISGWTSIFISVASPFPRIEEEEIALVQVNQKGRKPDMNMIKEG